MQRGTVEMSRDEPAEPGSTPRLYQRVYLILSQEIENGVLTPDEPITETGIAARFGVSRAPARRALSELEASGHVGRNETRGYTVRNGGWKTAQTGNAPAVASDQLADDKLVSLPTWERIYGEVEAEIIARISFATWRVNEAELARYYKVSRTVARDVIGRLQQSGLVQKDDRSRWYAPALAADHVGELYELRWVLEPVALEKAVPNLPSDLLPRLRDNLVRAIAMGDQIGGGILDSLEHDLHKELLGYCGNRALMQAITYPQSLLVAHRFLYRWTALLYEQEPFLPEHLDIIDRIAAGKIAEAKSVLEAHLRISRERAIERIDLIAQGALPDPLPYLDQMG